MPTPSHFTNLFPLLPPKRKTSHTQVKPHLFPHPSSLREEPHQAHLSARSGVSPITSGWIVYFPRSVRFRRPTSCTFMQTFTRLHLPSLPTHPYSIGWVLIYFSLVAPRPHTPRCFQWYRLLRTASPDKKSRLCCVKKQSRTPKGQRLESDTKTLTKRVSVGVNFSLA